jgi:CheY-like chemotaxis protein
MRDSGIGIAPENHARIFSGFTQAESSTTRRFGGTGLGVAISQRFVTMMGGELALESALGEGSRFYFTVTLPLAEAAPEADQTVAELSVAPMRALMVDDNPIARDILEQMGLSLGWTVDLAETGEQALALLKSQALAGISYQAVFVDWQMPGMDGWQTSHSIHETPLADEMPVIVMVTAHGREMLAQRSQADQDLINGFLVKPVTALMLKEAVLAARVGPLASRVMVDSSQRLTGLRLLLVEDNLNNQQVARELLEAEGATVQVANHGQEGVEAIAAASVAFDVVLMDLQMPVMDGFAATHHIRNVLGLKNLPVVAMTANAMASDREACLAAGMNDHVGKPFDLNDLVRVLCKQAGRTEVSHAAPAPAAALPPIAIEVADRAGVDLVGALRRLGGNHKVYQRMLATFAHDLATMPSQLNTAVQQGDTDSARRLLHTLKGLAASLGATALSSAAAQGEKQMAAKPSAAEMTVLAQSACVAIDAALPGLTHLHQTLLAEAQASDASSQGPQTLVDKPALLNALKVMAAQLKDSDMDAMQSMAELQQQFGSALGERLGALEAAMAELDFDAALPHCNALIESINA